MAKQDLNLGATPNDGTGDPLRDAMDKVNDNFLEVYNALGGSTPTTIVNSGQLELTGSNKITFLYSDLASLPSASSYHGMFAHVHATGGAYYAHAGSWLELANKSAMDALTTSSLTDVSSTAPSTGQVLKWDGSEWAPAADSAGSSLGADAITAGMIAENVVTTREIAANTVAVGDLATDISIDFLADVDTTTVAPTDGQALVWDNANSIWEPGTISSGSSYADSDVDTHLNVSGASSGQILSWNGTDYAWVADQTGGGGGGGTPGGSDTQVQYNNSGAFGAEADFTYNASTNTLSVVNLVATNITATGAGTQTISAGANIELDATNRVLVTDTPFRLASFTTTTRNAIASPANGDMIYNTTTNQLESYENSAWVATAGTSGGSYANSDVDTHLNTSSATSGQVLSWDGSDYAWAADATGGATAISTAGNTGTGSVTFASETLTATGATGQINVEAAGFALSFSLDADLTGLTSINGHTIPSGSGTLALTSDYADGINVTDESSDVTCFPMFGTGATGALTVKTDQSAYKYNASTGALTATAFIGDGSGLTNIPDNTPTFAVTAPDSGRYQFNGAGTDGDDNATLYLYRGFTYKFAVNSPGHPFHIQTSSGAYNASNLYTDNITNPGTQSGTITWTVQMDAPSTLYYVCQYHSAMAGTINIV